VADNPERPSGEEVGDRLGVGALVALHACLVIVGMFVADWAAMTCVAQIGPPDCGSGSIQLWAVAACDPFEGCSVPWWAETWRVHGVVMFWLTALGMLGIAVTMTRFMRGRSVPRFAVGVALVLVVGTLGCMIASWWNVVPRSNHGPNQHVGSAAGVLMLAQIAGLAATAYARAAERRRGLRPPPMPAARTHSHQA